MGPLLAVDGDCQCLLARDFLLMKDRWARAESLTQWIIGEPTARRQPCQPPTNESQDQKQRSAYPFRLRPPACFVQSEAVSLYLRGRGSGCSPRPVRNRFEDNRHHGVRFRQHLQVVESQDPNAVSLDKRCARQIVGCLVGQAVLTAVNLDSKLQRSTVEVEKVRTKWLPSMELRAG